jgi:hypothetical protein
MADEEKKIIIDDDWKAQAQAEREKLAEEQKAAAEQPLPDASFAELLNMLVMQAMAGFGAMATPDGQRIPPNMGIAKHFVDMLQVLSDKTQGNLTEEEQKILDQVLYELRMRYVEMATAAAGGGQAPGGAAPSGGGEGPSIVT